MTEQKFRPLDILRNSMLSNETVKGAENLALMYSFYQSCKLHGVNFEEYMKKVLAVMTMNMDKIIFEKNKNGTITGFKSHTISNEVLDELCHGTKILKNKISRSWGHYGAFTFLWVLRVKCCEMLVIKVETELEDTLRLYEVIYV